MACLCYQLTIFWVICISLICNVCVTKAESCAAVRSDYLRQGFDDEVPEYAIPGDHLKFCNNEDSSSTDQLTCCTPVMEHKLSVLSRQDFDTKLKKSLNPFSNLFKKKHVKFDELFTNLLNFSRRNFDRMFEKTYGVMYLQNARIFTDLFETFDDYYTKGDKNMRTEMDNFFKKLYEKIFTVYNSQYVFSIDYLKCVNSHMKELKPFGDEPEKLTTNIKRSFVAFRTFVQGLATAASVVENVLLVNPSMTCLHELMKMSHCSTCAGHRGVKPCFRYCRHIQKLCLAHHLPLAELWNNYVDAMTKLGDRLEGPFNIGHEVPPINLKISNAIMNFQESGLKISKKVFQSCGQPLLGRVARSTRGELEFESIDFPRQRETSDDDALRSHDEAITRLIREIKAKVKNSKNFWSELPAEMCKEARHHGPSNCWTGKGLGKYEGGSLLNSSQPSHNPQMDEQMFLLKLITNKLEEAYLGRDVSWMDEDWLEAVTPTKTQPQDDEAYEGSGDGWNVNLHSRVSSGIPGAQYPPDDEDGYPQNEGSGDDSQGHNWSGIEGSGADPIVKTDYTPREHNPPQGPYDNVPPPYQTPKVESVPPQKENPSAAPFEKPMSLTWAVAVYLLPAVFTFLGTIG